MDAVDIAIPRLSEQYLGATRFSFVRMCGQIMKRKIRFRFNNFANKQLLVKLSNYIDAKELLGDVICCLIKETSAYHVLMAYSYCHVFNRVHCTPGCLVDCERIRLSRHTCQLIILYHLNQHDPTTRRVAWAVYALPSAHHLLPHTHGTMQRGGSMSHQRVLILSARVGTGHTVAASALEDAFRRQSNAQVVNQDVLELTNEAYTKLSADAYLLVAKRMPWVLGWVYDVNDIPSEQPLRKLWDMLNTQPVVRFIKAYRPHICVCTHFIPAGIIAQLIAMGQLDTSLWVVTTDYDVQSMWLSHTFNGYFVARDESKARLINLGVVADRITVSGIPVRPQFGAPADRDVVLAQYDLRADLPVILVSAGAVGAGPAQAIVAQIMNMQHAVQCVVICGTNHRLRQAVEALTFPQAARFRVLGFTTDMVNLMRVATLFVGKPGGLTTAECMAAGTPMMIVTPIPGQEERNADYLLEEGAAVRCNDLEIIDYKLDRLLSDPRRLERLRSNARRVGRPHAAQVIATTALADRRAPARFDWRAVVAPRSPAARVPARRPWEATTAIDLYDDERGVHLGTVTNEQFRMLRRVLSDFDGQTGTATLTMEQVARFRARGGDPQVCDILAARIARSGPMRLRRSKVRGTQRLGNSSSA